MNNKEVAHLWANNSQKSTGGSNFYFLGDTIYSYGAHFPIARHHKGVVLFTSNSYSQSTARHISIVRMATSHKVRFTVADVKSNPCAADLKLYRKRIDNAAMVAACARDANFALSCLGEIVNEANLFAEKFGFKSRFTMPDNLPALKERAKLTAARERKEKAARIAKEERAASQAVSKWLAGESVTIPHNIGKVYLRVIYKAIERATPISDEHPARILMETSKGARVELTEAEKAFRFAIARRSKGWHRNGETFAVGDYHLDAVNEQGIVAGCHRIEWGEIERFAKLQGWA